MIRQNDQNGNGTLERNEWKGLRGNPDETDANGDGVLTRDELADQLAAFGSRGRGPSRSGSDASGSGSNAGPPARRRRSYRFLSPVERLPEGLPEWFARNDANADGQVMMSEFARTWTDAKAAEFSGYDLNSDGVITPAECQKAAR